jgi:hypothetical protein
MKENEFRNLDEVKEFVRDFWSDMTLEEVQLLFHEWVNRLE